MKSIQIKNSYNVWSPGLQKLLVNQVAYVKYANKDATFVLHRPWISLHFEWWLHNLGYYLTVPFIKNKKINQYNLRFKDVDLKGVNYDY